MRYRQSKGVKMCYRTPRCGARLINHKFDNQVHLAPSRCSAFKDSSVVGEAARGRLHRNKSVARGYCLDNRLGVFSCKIVHVREESD